MGQLRNRRHADRVRAAICVALADADRPMTITELVAAIEGLGIELGSRPNKTVSDAARWEAGRGHVRRVARATYARDRLPHTTEYYMRRRIKLYAADPTQGYSRPNYYPRPNFD
jgi:hypothetical protein